ncbi:hypothetical protein CKF54_07135 [Psittacicella hinzii]|uniref:EamA-like transporter family protein n=2 Tax=Psittacicella hinzii TaxID=2028575 RepID=A0A3A1Y1S2_9GAMM|nr:hypothetical protein CKF54_07135 [Psittacicella hinzii]
MGKAVQTSGIAKADTASRISLAIGILASFTIFQQKLTVLAIIGVALAFVAILMLLNRGQSARTISEQIAVRESKFAWLWLFLVWLGYGSIDVLLKLMAVKDTMSLLMLIFILAAVVMLVYNLQRKTKFNFASVLAGILLGALNFTNIFTYVRAHQELHGHTALVFTSMNIGVIALSLLVGVIFKERISKVNYLGILLAVVAIGLIALGRN